MKKLKKVEGFRLEDRHVELLDNAPGSRGDTVRLLIELGLNGERADMVVADYLDEVAKNSSKSFVLNRAASILKTESALDDCQEALNL